MSTPRRPRPISARPAHDAAVATEQAAATTVDDVGSGPGQAAAEITEVAAAKTVGAVAAAEDTARTTVVHQTAAEVRAAQRRLRIFIIVAAVVVLLLNLLVLLWFVNAQVKTAKEDVARGLTSDLKERDDKIAVLAAAVDASRADAIAKGQQPVVPPADALVSGVQQVQQAQGPTDEQIRAAVTLYLLANPPQAGRGADRRRGQSSRRRVLRGEQLSRRHRRDRRQRSGRHERQQRRTRSRPDRPTGRGRCGCLLRGARQLRRATRRQRCARSRVLARLHAH